MSEDIKLLKRLHNTQKQVMNSLEGYNFQEGLTILSSCMANLLVYSIHTDVISAEQACDVLEASLDGVKQVINMTSKVANKPAFELNQ